MTVFGKNAFSKEVDSNVKYDFNAADETLLCKWFAALKVFN